MRTDRQIQQDVIEELQWDPRLISTDVDVVVKNGTVILRGSVDTFSKKILIEKAVKKVKEVKRVLQEIEVKIHQMSIRADSAIEYEISKFLKWNVGMMHNKIHLTVDGGLVTLEGYVYWEFQKDEICQFIHNMIGIKGVRNMLTLASFMGIPIEKDALLKALKRSALIHAKKIDITIRGNTVALSGKVKTWIEYDEAECVTWNTPGVLFVENNLRVS